MPTVIASDPKTALSVAIMLRTMGFDDTTQDGEGEQTTFYLSETSIKSFLDDRFDTSIPEGNALYIDMVSQFSNKQQVETNG